jgi:hypothetical protein
MSDLNCLILLMDIAMIALSRRYNDGTQMRYKRERPKVIQDPHTREIIGLATGAFYHNLCVSNSNSPGGNVFSMQVRW